MAIFSNFTQLLRRRPVTSFAIALGLAVTAMLFYARYWITTDAGRDFVVSQVDGREVAGYGKLSLRNIEGDPLSEFTVGSIEIRDASGVWISAQSVAVSWSPMDLISRRVELADLSVKVIDVERRPVRTPTPPSRGKPWDVRLGKATIERLNIAEGIAGPASASAISARFLNAKTGEIDAQLKITPLEGAGDQIDARIKRDRSSAFDLQIDAVAPANGLFAHILQLPQGASAVLAASAAGDLSDGRGEARLTIDGADKVLISGKIEQNTLETSARLDATALPVSDRITGFLGSNVDIGLLASFERKALRFAVDGRFAAGTLKLAGKSRLDRFELLEPAQLNASLTTLLPFWDGARGLVLDGELSRPDEGWQYSGDAALTVAPESSLPFDAVSGPVTATLEDGRLPFSGNVTVVNLLSGNAQIAKIIGEEVAVSGNGVYEFATRRVLMDAVELTHASGTAQLLGEANFSDGGLSLSGKVAQDIGALPGGFGGSATGFAQAKGQLRDFELGLNLNLAGVSTRLETLAPLVNGRGTLRGMLTIQPDAGTIQRMDIKLPGIEAQVSGRAYGQRSPDLKIEAKQLVPLIVAGNQINLGSVTAQLRRNFAGLRLSGSSEDGRAVISGRTITSLVSQADLLLADGNISGPISLSGVSQGQPATAKFVLDRRGALTQFDAIDGKIGTITLSGSAAISDDGVIDADIDADASTFKLGGVTFGSLKLKASSAPRDGRPAALGAAFEATDVVLTSRLALDRVTGNVTTTPQGYRFDGRVLDDKTGVETDVAYAGLFKTDRDAPAGTLSLSGQLFGAPISTRKDIDWSLGQAPSADIDLALLGGSIQAQVRSGDESDSSRLVIDKLALSPVLIALGLPEFDAVISGNAQGRLYGDNPKGTFALSGTSGLSGLKTALDLTLGGQFDRRALTFTAQAGYGPDLAAQGTGRLPVIAAPGAMMKLDRDSRINLQLDVDGELDALRLIALAYGHDMGGTIKSRSVVAGTLETPDVSANAVISQGRYEYGATGLSLKDLEVNASYQDTVLTLSGKGAGTQGGAVTFDGRLAETETGVKVVFDRLLVYDKLGDQARISGDAQLVEGTDDRVLSGALAINDARFNVDNFSSNSIRTLNVRWESDDPDAARQTILSKPIRLNVNVTAKRGVTVRGRGLDSDWGVNLDVTGTPSSLLVNGKATLVRGTLELAQRPFEFETGQITFDGPLTSARMAISASREVDGFTVSADVSGTPAKPTIELSSSPSLPEDEILSRMLFGRSSIDLSALEAAELASSIARLSGRDTGIDPIGAIQSGLGVDRLRFGIDSAGNAELGVGQYLAPDVYLEVTTQGAAGNSVEVEWQPRPQVSVASETSSTGESRVSIRWKKDY